MAENLAFTMHAMIILLFLAILPTRMRQHHRRILRLRILLAVAVILRHVILGVAVIAVRTGPRKEG